MQKLNKRAFDKIQKSAERHLYDDALKRAEADTHIIKCPKCGSEIAVNVGNNVCRFCGAEINFEISFK